MIVSAKTKTLSQQLFQLKQNQFTGKLEINSLAESQNWTLYLCLGRLIWAEGGCHPHRSWQRCLAQCNSQISRIFLKSKNKFSHLECSNYYFLNLLVKQNLISKERATTIIKTKIVEVLFEIIQQEQSENLEYNTHEIAAALLGKYGLNISLFPLTVEESLAQTRQEWSIWVERGLKNFSPNLAPIIREPEQLKERLPRGIYTNLRKLLKGQLSWRDLAVNMNKEVVSLSSSLSPYIERQWIDLVEIPDLEAFNPLFQLAISGAPSQRATSNQPLIACVDDSPQIGEILKYICSQANCKFISIQKPLEALPKLISSSPSLIFLDLTMPIVNGYELCTQIKRTSKLKDVPVIILTSNDGMVDRMKAKLVGSSGFLSKPIQKEKILQTIQKYLSLPRKCLQN